MGKKEDKARRAAEARALLGIDDDAGPRPNSNNEREDVPKPAVHGRGTKRVAVPPGPDSGVEGRRAKGAPSSKRPTALIPKGKASFEIEPPPPTSSPLPSVGQDIANDDATKAKLFQVVRPDGKVPESYWPKKHLASALTRGTSVWYRGQRFYVEFCPSAWSNGCYVRICEKPVNPDRSVRSGSDLAYINEKGEGRGAAFQSFCVHADLLSLAPTVGTIYHRQPTMAGVERKERAARGERDVGDPVAVELRAAKSLDDVYRIGAEFLSVQESELRNRYGHLNPGQQRMNIGNRMRAKWRKEQK